MKTTNKILVSAVTFLFALMSVQAQVENSDFTSIGDATVNIDSVSVGSTNGYYIMPDTYYHPNYNGANSWTLTAGFTWTWDVTAGAIANDADNADNYVEVEFPSTGTYVLAGRETSPAAYGACSSEDTTITVEVLDTASFSVIAGGGYISANTEVCEGDATLSNLLGINIADNAGNGANYNLQWSLTIYTLQADHTTPVNYYNTDESTNVGAGNPAISYTAAAPAAIANPGVYDLTHVNDGEFSAIGGASTVYEYTVTSINDRFSRKSEYLSLLAANGGTPGFATTPDDFTYYGAGDEEFTITITVNPAPVTGPIYHIPNNWAN